MPKLKILKDSKAQDMITRLHQLDLPAGHPLIGLDRCIRESSENAVLDKNDKKLPKDDLVFIGAMWLIGLGALWLVKSWLWLGLGYSFCLAFLIGIFLLDFTRDMLNELNDIYAEVNGEEMAWYDFVESCMGVLDDEGIETDDFLMVLGYKGGMQRWLNLFQFRDSQSFPKLFKMAFGKNSQEMIRVEEERETRRWLSAKVDEYTPILHTLMLDGEVEGNIRQEGIRRTLLDHTLGKSRRDLEAMFQELEIRVSEKIREPHTPLNIHDLSGANRYLKGAD